MKTNDELLLYAERESLKKRFRDQAERDTWIDAFRQGYCEGCLEAITSAAAMVSKNCLTNSKP